MRQKYIKITLGILLGACFVILASANTAKASYLEKYIGNVSNFHKTKFYYNETVYNDVLNYYKSRNFSPIWIENDNAIKDKAFTALNALKISWQHGLNPERYYDENILGAKYSNRRSVLARSEFLISYGLALYAHDMTSMRVDPKSIKQYAKYWREPVKPSAFLNKLINSDNVSKDVLSLAPQNKLYRKLKDEYVRLVSTEELFENHKKVSLKGLIRPGQSHKVIADFRERMGLPKKRGMDNYLYDDELATAIQSFQKDNGLKTDGVLGPQTVKYLNRTARDRADQLLANMERMRWLEPNRPSKYIEVNIPSMSLWAFENHRPALSMPVVVGREQRQTRSFKTEITGVRINPRWIVPHGIRSRDFWPKLKEDASILAEKQIDVVEGFGHEAIYHDPTALDWENMSWREFNKYRLIQKPGDHNALGRIRVLMPNDHTIYLHDTNDPELFEKDYRAGSSGCIRLKYPDKLAEFILKDHEVTWGSEKMDNIYSSLKPKDLKTEETMPIYILYQTNWLNGNGEVVFGPDLYKRDKKLIQAMKDQGIYFDPERNAPQSDIKLASR